MIDNKFEEFKTNDGGSLFYIESNSGKVTRYYMGPNCDLNVREEVPYSVKRHAEILQMIITGDSRIIESPPEELPPEEEGLAVMVNHHHEDNTIKIIDGKIVNTVSGKSMDIPDPETLNKSIDLIIKLLKGLKEESDK